MSQTQLRVIDPTEFEPVFERYALRRKRKRENFPMPQFLDEAELPPHRGVLRPEHSEWLESGFDGPTDRSSALQAVTKALYSAGWSDEAVFSTLTLSPGSMQIALDHRNDDHDKALEYLWNHHCLDARSVSPLNDFKPIVSEELGIPGFITAGELLKRGTAPRWLVKDLIEEETVGVWFGEPGSYKSFVAMDVCLHIATGKPWCGREVKQGPVILIVGEGQGGIARRLAAWQHHHQANLESFPIVFTTGPEDLFDEVAFTGLGARLDKLVEQIGHPVVIVIDTLAKNMGGGDENKTVDMSLFVNHVIQLRARYETSVQVVHHTGHKNKDRARGSIALLGGIDFEFRVEKSRGFTVRIINDRQKDSAESADIALKGAPVFFDPDNDDVSSLVFVMANPDDLSAQALPPVRGKKQQEVLQVLESKSAKGLESGMSEDELWAQCKAAGMKRQTFTSALEALQQSGHIEMDEKGELVWTTW